MTVAKRSGRGERKDGFRRPRGRVPQDFFSIADDPKSTKSVPNPRKRRERKERRDQLKGKKRDDLICWPAKKNEKAESIEVTIRQEVVWRMHRG